MAGLKGITKQRTVAPDSEAALYRPVKRFLEMQGYTVKGEVHHCDLVACRGGEPPVIVELKRRFNLPLVLQGIDRLVLSERVYLAVPRPPRRAHGLNPESGPVRRLCRRLGLGLLLVGRSGSVAVIEDPIPYRPRPAKRRIELLLGEFARRTGDLNIGGRRGIAIVTAYRQDALRCAQALQAGALPLRALRAVTGVADAASILQRNVYGWFERIERGTYALNEAGRAGLVRFADAAAALTAADVAA